jgi:hypothetical protein
VARGDDAYMGSRLRSARTNSARAVITAILSVFVCAASLAQTMRPTDGQEEPPAAFLRNAANFDDPLCLDWTDGCTVCSRSKTDLAAIDCSNTKPGCEPHFPYCTHPNAKLISRFCDVVRVGNNRCIGLPGNVHYACTKLGPVPLRPQTSLVICEHFLGSR